MQSVCEQLSVSLWYVPWKKLQYSWVSMTHSPNVVVQQGRAMMEHRHTS